MRVAHEAYIRVHSVAVLLNDSLSVLYWRAISGTSGSSGLGSVSKEHTESKTLEIVSAGDHWSFKISKQMPPLLLIFGW